MSGNDNGRDLAAIIAGGSHDIRLRRRWADSRIIRKAIGYAERGAYVSLKIIRAADDEVDDNKFLMPVFGNLSSLDLQLFYMLRERRIPRVVAVVSGEGKMKAEAVGAFTDSMERLRIVSEPNPTGFFKTHKVALDDLRDLPDEARIGFVALDTPLAYDLTDMLHREEPFDGIYMDCNARENVFSSGKELFNRNWYFIIKTREGNVVHAKECNRWEYNLGRLRGSLKQVETNSGHSVIYGNREAGNVISSRFLWNMIKLLPSRVVDNPELAAKFLSKGLPAYWAYYRGNRSGRKFGGEAVIDVEKTEYLAGFVLGMPVRLEFKNTDLALVRDIDDRYDRDYYHLIFDAAVERYGGVREAFIHLIPNGEELYELDKEMRKINLKIPMLDNFPAHENKRRQQLREVLRDYGRMHGRGYDLEIRDAFDSDGIFIGQHSKGDDIIGSLDYFVEKAARFRNA